MAASIPVRTFLIAGAGIALAGLALRDAATSFWLSAPASSPSWLHSEPQIDLGRRGTALPGNVSSGRRAIARAARDALRSEPLNPTAMRQLAFADETAGAGSSLARLELAERISRRDILTEIALLELRANSGDFRSALDHLDRALTTQPEAGQSVYPQLVKILRVPEFRLALAAFGKRPWFGPLVLAAVASPEVDPHDTADLMIVSRMEIPPTLPEIMPVTLGRLLDQGNYELARELAQVVGKAKPKALDDFELKNETSDPRFAPLTWRLSSNDIVQARIDRAGVLEVEMQPGAPALVAERITHLPAGSYKLEHQSIHSASTPALRAEWLVNCKNATEADEKLWQQQLPVGNELMRDRGDLRVPDGCPLQHWQLRALVDDTQEPVHFKLTTPKLAGN